jgi:glyoxylase-like metal-dependent hydrolase (beta-lactamase superfamily II)/rhodanese-related sulfurtransferase
MIFRQILYDDLGCASYFLADGGQAVVVDPRWDVDVYIELAAVEGVRIAHVLDTHQHADHVSGRDRLAALTGACAYAPRDASAPPDASRDGEAGHTDAHAELVAGEEIAVGSLRLRALATPGHRPEHLSILVSDVSRGEDPWLVLSGDSLLVGDLARPDLAVEARTGARALHASVRELLALGDRVELWPAHVGGSLCGGAGLSGKTSSTLGYERAHNPLLELDEERFVEELLRELPPRPPNIDRVVSLNRARTVPPPPLPVELDVSALLDEIAAGARVVDGRAPDAFDAGHLPGAINLPAGRARGTRAGWVLSPEDRLVVIGADREQAHALAAALHAVGLWGVVGLAAGDPARWLERGVEVRRSVSWDVATLVERLRRDEIQLIDVRERDEWRRGHLRGSRSVPLHRLADPDAIASSRTVGSLAVACAGGARAAFAASVIRRSGHAEVIRVAGGGIGDLPRHGVALTQGE